MRECEVKLTEKTQQMQKQYHALKEELVRCRRTRTYRFRNLMRANESEGITLDFYGHMVVIKSRIGR